MLDENPKNTRTLLIQLLLFVLTFGSVTLAGTENIYGNSIMVGIDWLSTTKLIEGLQFSVPFLLILTAHEFGHYFTARKYGIRTSLPFYIPMPISMIGTLGAFIRIKEIVKSRKEYFDIGIAGPLAGFVLAVGVLWYGFTHLPPPEYIFNIHPDYQKFGLSYADFVYKGHEVPFWAGKNLLFVFFEQFVATDTASLPNVYEMMHYPYLWAGYIACFFTALNLMPIGQLDGGHILYGLVGARNHKIVSTALFMVFVYFAGLGIVTPTQVMVAFDYNILIYLVFLYVLFSKIGANITTTFLMAFGILTAQFTTSYLIPDASGFSGWLVFAFVLGRFLGINHPPVQIDQPLDMKRKVLGWISLLIFILCFSPVPFVIM